MLAQVALGTAEGLSTRGRLQSGIPLESTTFVTCLTRPWRRRKAAAKRPMREMIGIETVIGTRIGTETEIVTEIETKIGIETGEAVADAATATGGVVTTATGGVATDEVIEIAIEIATKIVIEIAIEIEIVTVIAIEIETGEAIEAGGLYLLSRCGSLQGRKSLRQHHPAADSFPLVFEKGIGCVPNAISTITDQRTSVRSARPRCRQVEHQYPQLAVLVVILEAPRGANQNGGTASLQKSQTG